MLHVCMKMLPLLICILVLAGSPSKGDHAAGEFKSVPCSPSSDYFVPCGPIVSVLQGGQTEDVYVTLENGIYELDKDLNPRTFVFTSTGHGETEMNDLTVLTDSHIILCKNDAHGSCELRDLSSLDLVDGFLQNGVVDNRDGRDGRSLAWIGRGPRGEGVLHVALSTKGKNSSAPILATRHLTRFNGSHMDGPEDFLTVVRNEYFAPSAQWPNVYRLPVDIEPIYGFSDEDYDYLLKRHTSRQGGAVETKLIRLCRKDVNYRSYIELKLQCISSTGVIYRNASSAVLNSDALLVSFQHRDSSSVCRYNLSNLNDRFLQRRKECLSGNTSTAEIDWYQEIPCPSNPIPSAVFNISILEDPDFCYELDVAHPLGGNRPIEKDALFTIDAIVNAVAVGQHQGDTIYLLGDDTGKLFKMRWRSSVWERGVDTGGSSPVSTNGVFSSADGDAVYVVTQWKVTKRPVDFNLQTEPPTQPSTTAGETGGEKSFEPHIIYIISGSAAIVVIVIVIIVALSIKFGLRKYNMNLG